MLACCIDASTRSLNCLPTPSVHPTQLCMVQPTTQCLCHPVEPCMACPTLSVCDYSALLSKSRSVPAPACVRQPSNSGGRPASLSFSTAAAVSLPSHAWYTRPRAPSPTSSHTGILQQAQHRQHDIVILCLNHPRQCAPAALQDLLTLSVSSRPSRVVCPLWVGGKPASRLGPVCLRLHASAQHKRMHARHMQV